MNEKKSYVFPGQICCFWSSVHAANQVDFTWCAAYFKIKLLLFEYWVKSRQIQPF